MMEKIQLADAVNEIRENLPEATMWDKGLFGNGALFFNCMDSTANDIEIGPAKNNGFKPFRTESEPRKGVGLEITFSGVDFWLTILAYDDGDIFVKAGSTMNNNGWKKLAFAV